MNVLPTLLICSSYIGLSDEGGTVYLAAAMKQFMQPNADEVAKLEQVSPSPCYRFAIVAYILCSSSPRPWSAIFRTRISLSRRWASLVDQHTCLPTFYSLYSSMSRAQWTTTIRAMSIGAFGGRGTKVSSDCKVQPID